MGASDTLKGVGSGAATGATIGSVVPGVGTLLGAGLGAGIGLLGGVMGYSAQKKADKLTAKALAQREMEYAQRAPLRRQGMQQLAAVEQPYDMKGLGFNASNPFAAARGPLPSNATYHDTSRFVTDPAVMDQAISGTTPDELAAAEDAMSGRYIGKSGGAMRFLTASGKQVTNQDRENAMAIQKRYQMNMGAKPPRQGVQPLGGG